MDMLELPIDLIWEGKPEPLSPSQLALANSEDVLIFDNNFANDLLLYDILKTSDFIYDDKKNDAELLFELQQHILTEAEEDADQWLDQPINLQVLDDYIPPTQVQPIKVEHTAQLLREFNSVFDAVELTHLTPPQTPPLTPPIIQNNDQKQQEFIFSSTPYQPATDSAYYVYYQNSPAQTPLPQDIAHEMEVVDEIVRSRAEDLPDLTDDEDAYESASISSASFSPRSESSYAGSAYSNDDEWNPKHSVKGGVKRRTKPNGRTPEDKKYRKKEQNKNAATRYRKKKKAEIEIFLEEEKELQEKNDKLQGKCADVQREIKYLKSLMRDLYRAKGIL